MEAKTIDDDEYFDTSLIINQKEYAVIESFTKCVICEDLLREPMKCTQCENNFCKQCIENWMKKSNTCPFKCKDFEVKPAKFISQMLEKIKFKCKNGCDAEIPYNDVEEHYMLKSPKIDFPQ